jgi:hypothetical protein
MSYTNVEILSGVLVVACLMLLWCQRSSNVDGLHGKPQSGLVIRDGYVSMPLAGHFNKTEGYVTGRPGDRSLSYTARASHFENTEDSGLNDLHTVPTPPSTDHKTPTDSDPLRWAPDVGINEVDFSDDTLPDLYHNVFKRQINQVKTTGDTLSGASLRYIDYGANMVQTRQVTM